MLSEKVFPSTVTEFDQSLGRLYDIREQDAGEYAVLPAFGARPVNYALNARKVRTRFA